MPRSGRPFGRRSRLRWHFPEPKQYPSLQNVGSEAGINVGGNLRRLREEKNLTFRTLAERSGLAINTLSLIENGKSSPSVSTLQQLGLALGVPITAFFEIQTPQANIAYIKACQRPRAIVEYGHLEDLGAGSSIQNIEPFILNLEPNASSGAQDCVHTGYEFVFCLEGRMAYTIEGKPYLLEPGDSLLFEAHLPHHWQNLSQNISRAILVLHPTDENDSPTGRHFNLANPSIQE